MYWYQVDRRQADGTLDRYDMYQATSFDDLIQNLFLDSIGLEREDMEIIRKRANGRMIVTIYSPGFTAAYWEVYRMGRVMS